MEKSKLSYTDLNLSGKKILITGGAGFIGSNLVRHFQTHHPQSQLIVFDSFRNQEKFENGHFKSLGHYHNLLDFRGQVIAGNLNNFADLERLSTLSFDYIFHQAAISDTTVTDQELVLRTNTNSFFNLLELARQKNARMIYASSAGVYGNSPAPNKVGAGEKPENIYGFSKLMMDRMAAQYLLQYPQVSIIGLRYFNVYGEGEFYKGTTASMILQLGLQALKNKEIRLFKYGEQLRDFIYVEDVIQANIKAMNCNRSGVYNVGTGQARSFNDIMHILQGLIGKFDVDYMDNPYTFYQNHTEADISDTKEYLRFEPNYTLEGGISAYLPEIRHIYETIIKA